MVDPIIFINSSLKLIFFPSHPWFPASTKCGGMTRSCCKKCRKLLAQLQNFLNILYNHSLASCFCFFLLFFQDSRQTVLPMSFNINFVFDAQKKRLIDSDLLSTKTYLF